MGCALGVDAGDTFTDAVLFDLRKERVRAVAKVPTTHEELSRGIFKALDNVMCDVNPDDIIQVSLSSTLATNSIVEGRGRDVGLLMLGREPDEERRFPGSRRAYVSGKFNPRGEEIEPLDRRKVVSLVKEWREEVVGFAVSGYFGVRNPQHEEEVREIIEKLTSKPVITGHSLSQKLGFYERSVTVVLNVKIIPIITSFVEEAEAALEERGIDAPLMMVKSDGSLAESSEIKKKPIETVFSGPAASSIGARWLSGKDDCVVIDIGGTTVDIAILRDGLPTSVESGVQVGKWRTKVRSMDLRSVGLGGDSRVKLDKEENLVFGPSTAKPLAFGNLSSLELDEVNAKEDASFLKATEGEGKDLDRLNESTKEFYRLIGEGIVNRRELLDKARERGLLRGNSYLRELERLGFVRRIALTPTDILHVMGDYVAGKGEASRAGVELLARRKDREVREFAREVKSAFEREIMGEVAKKFILEEKRGCDFDRNPLWEFCKDGGEDFSVNFKLDLPIVGIGAPAGAFLPRVASRLGTDFVEVEYYEAGNAVGAVVGQVTQSMEVLVVEKPESEEFLLFLPDERKVIEETEEDEALAFAREYAKDRCKELVHRSGGREVSSSAKTEGFVHGRTTIEIVSVGTPRRDKEDDR